MKRFLFVLAFLLPTLFAFRALEMDGGSCGTPTNVQKTASTPTSISYGWSAVSGSTAYKVYYVRRSDGYTSPQWTTSNTSYTFTGLSAGTHSFYFASVCGGDVSEFIVIDDIIGT